MLNLGPPFLHRPFKNWSKKSRTQNASLSHACLDLKIRTQLRSILDAAVLITIEALHHPNQVFRDSMFRQLKPQFRPINSVKCLWQVEANNPHGTSMDSNLSTTTPAVIKCSSKQWCGRKTCRSSGWQASSDGSMRASNIYANIFYVNRKMAIGLKSFVVLARDDFGSMMKRVMDHFEGTVPVKSTSLKRGNKWEKKSAGAHSTSSATKPISSPLSFCFSLPTVNFNSSIDHNCPVKCAGCEGLWGLPENNSTNMANSSGKGWWPTCLPTSE